MTISQQISTRTELIGKLMNRCGVYHKSVQSQTFVDHNRVVNLDRYHVCLAEEWGENELSLTLETVGLKLVSLLGYEAVVLDEVAQ